VPGTEQSLVITKVADAKYLGSAIPSFLLRQQISPKPLLPE